MTLPITVRTAVSPETLAKVTRLFNGTAGDVLAELFQNARRAGASRVDVTTDRETDALSRPGRDGRLRLTVADDGSGISDPAALLTLSRSGWAPETLSSEDPAGMGLFALAGRTVRVASHGAAGDWGLTVPASAWTSGAELLVEPGRGPHERGTAVSLAVEEAWARDLKADVERAARHFPLPVTFDGAEVPRCAFLVEAQHVEDWRGLRLGVVRDHHVWRKPSINFHGVTVACPLPQVAEVRGPTWTVLVEVVDCPELQLVLPARKEVVATPFLESLREACERAIYRSLAARERHGLPFEHWRRAAALGVDLPPAAAELLPWSPVTNDGDTSSCVRRRSNDTTTPLPAEALVMGEIGPDLEQSLARAFSLSDPGLKDRLVEACPAFEGYGWYDRLPRVVEVVGTIVRGGTPWTTQPDRPPLPASGAVDRAWLVLTIRFDEGTVSRALETDLILVANEVGSIDDPDEQGVFAVPGPRLSPGDVADAVLAAFFMATDDREADSWETQVQRYEGLALDLARRLLLGDAEADLARLRDAVRDHLAWLVPRGRELRVRYDATSLEVSLAPLTEDLATASV